MLRRLSVLSLPPVKAAKWGFVTSFRQPGGARAAFKVDEGERMLVIGPAGDDRLPRPREMPTGRRPERRASPSGLGMHLREVDAVRPAAGPGHRSPRRRRPRSRPRPCFGRQIGRPSQALRSRSAPHGRRRRQSPASRVSTTVSRPGSGLPIDWKVLRPMIIGLPQVRSRKRLRSVLSRHSSWLSWPMTPLSATAATRMSGRRGVTVTILGRALAKRHSVTRYTDPSSMASDPLSTSSGFAPLARPAMTVENYPSSSPATRRGEPQAASTALISSSTKKRALSTS